MSRNNLLGSRAARTSAGFTLVELLVVIGIIALLIAMLLPALNRARAASKEVVCLSQLRQIGTGMMIHANEHRGYYPIAGYVHSTDATPVGLNDADQKHYSYYSEGAVYRPMTLAAAIGQYMGQQFHTDSKAALQADLNDPGQISRRVFSCPSDDIPMYGISIKSNVGSSWTGPTMYSSYAFNEALLGWTDTATLSESRGLSTRIKQSSRTLLLCDNKVRGGSNGSYFTIFANTTPANLEQAYLNFPTSVGAGPDLNSFDQFRHRGRMNVLFADGHGETIPLPKPGSVYSDTGSLSQIYIVAP